MNFKKLITNCLSTTAMTLIVLSIIATLSNAQFLYIKTVFQAFIANSLIHIGLYLIQKFESKYFFIELLLEVGYTLIILIMCGFIFNWYTSTPLWMVILMGIGIYIIGCIFSIIRINEDISYINKKLKKINQS